MSVNEGLARRVVRRLLRLWRRQQIAIEQLFGRWTFPPSHLLSSQRDLRTLGHVETGALRSLLAVYSTDLAYALLMRVRSVDTFLQRREPIYDSLVRASSTSSLLTHAYASDDADAILIDLVRSASSLSIPWFVPMREAIETGFSFDKEPRILGIVPFGGRSAREKLTREATFAARVFRWVASSDGTLSKEEQRMLRLFFAAIAMPHELAEALMREPAAPSLAAIERPTDLDAHIAESIVRGAHDIAAQDGLDEREDAAIAELATLLNVPSSLIAALNPSYPPPPPRIDPEAPDSSAAPPGSDPRDLARRDPLHRAHRDQLRLAYALVDCVRYLSLTFGSSNSLATSMRVCFRAVAPIYAQHDLELRFLGSGPSPFAQPHLLAAKEAPAVLASAWVLWLQCNPSIIEQAVLQERLHRVSHLLTQDDRASHEALTIVNPRVQKLLQRGVLSSGF